METLQFWREAEARFRSIRDLDLRRDLHAGRTDTDPAAFVAECGERVRSALETDGYPLDFIFSLERRALSVAARLVDGDYISLWDVSGGPNDRMSRETLQSRFRTEAALAARAADVVRAGATDDEAVDEWLNLLRKNKSPFFRDDELPIIEDLLEASAVQCAALATRAYGAHRVPASAPSASKASASLDVAPSEESGKMAAWLRAELDGRLLTERRLYELGGPEPRTTQRILAGHPASHLMRLKIVTGLAKENQHSVVTGRRLSVDDLPQD